MKYVMLIYANPANHPSQPAVQAMMAESGRIIEELTATGEMLSGEALAEPSEATAVRLRDSAPAITDGPFAEAKEHLAGFCLLDVATEERAREIAARWPKSEGAGGVELRRIVTPER